MEDLSRLQIRHCDLRADYQEQRDTMKRVFLGKAVNKSTDENCLQKPEASRFGARLAEAKQADLSWCCLERSLLFAY